MCVCLLVVGWFSHYRIKEHLVQCSHSSLPLKVMGEIIHCCLMLVYSMCMSICACVCDDTYMMAHACQLGEQIWIEWNRTKI